MPHKTKQFLALLLKLLIVVGAFYFIYTKLTSNKQLDWNKFSYFICHKISFWSFLLILFLSFLNRYLEILKWQNLVKTIKIISVGEATKQVLGSLTLALFTPNGIGEYAGKALFFEKSRTKKILFLNLICNGIQLLLTIFFGILGLIYFNSLFNLISTTTIVVTLGLVFFAFFLLFFLKKIKIKGYSIDKLLVKFNEIPKKIHQKNILFGVLRYLTFSHQYYFLFLLFEVHLSYFLLMAAITSVYFLASSLPSFQFFDFAVKGSVAIYFFDFLNVNEWIVILISTLMWILNTVIPVSIGSYFVLNFKPQWKS